MKLRNNLSGILLSMSLMTSKSEKLDYQDLADNTNKLRLPQKKDFKPHSGIRSDSMDEEEEEFWTRFLQLSSSLPQTLSPTSFPTLSSIPTAVPSTAPSFPCNVSPQTRQDEFFAIATTISDITLVSDNTTPQGQAFDWLVNIDPLFLCPDEEDAIIQRYSIGVFYFSTGAVSSPENLSSDHECNWPEIQCSSADAVLVVNIDQAGLDGSLPLELGQFTQLLVLKLEENLLQGVIPTSIGQNQKLIALDLNSNLMTGSIPDSLYTLSDLQQLDIDNNFFTGTLSDDIGNLESLTFLQLEENQFSGSIPENLGTIEGLEQVTFDQNLFTGTMPDSVCAKRGDGITGGSLVALNADCPPQFDCSCCTIIC